MISQIIIDRFFSGLFFVSLFPAQLFFLASQKQALDFDENNDLTLEDVAGSRRVHPDVVSLRDDHCDVHERLENVTVDRVQCERRPRVETIDWNRIIIIIIIRTVFPSPHRIERDENGIRAVGFRDRARVPDEKRPRGTVRGERKGDATGRTVRGRRRRRRWYM